VLCQLEDLPWLRLGPGPRVGRALEGWRRWGAPPARWPRRE